MFLVITVSLLLCLRVYLIFINREMFSCGNKLFFGEYKYIIVVVIKF